MRQISRKQQLTYIKMDEKEFSKPPSKQQPEPMARLWALRMLVKLGKPRSAVLPGTQFAEALGLPGIDEETTIENSGPVMFKMLRALHQKVERERLSKKLPPVLEANILRLAKFIELDEAAKLILAFIVMLKNDAMLLEAAESLGSMGSMKAINALTIILDLPEDAVKASLSTSAPLFRSGLLRIDRDSDFTLGDKFNLLCESFSDTMISIESDPVELLRRAVRASPRGALAASDYRHIGSDVAVLKTYLGSALETSQAGVNILLHGKPGTGKSELARLMSAELNCQLMEIVSEDEAGDPIDGNRRLSALRAAQCIFASKPTLILFDEIEDVFSDMENGFGGKSTGQTRKGWINQMLESNPVPCFWLTNSVSCIDPAFIRRFDMILELPVPPKSQRRQMISKSCQGMLDETSVENFATNDEISPAVLARASAVTRSVCASEPDYQPGVVLERLIRSTLAAQGLRSGLSKSLRPASQIYDPAFINTDSDLLSLSKGLAQTNSGRICLYGPPGTGKTAFGGWLAQELGRQLLVKRASDLFSKYVGESEKNIADAFAEAEAEGAVLLIDEVDSFLQNRRGAQRSWEVSQVNEFLTQMEGFTGIFIASTNLMDGMDQAAFRRFDIKARFDYLKVEQAWNLLQRYCTLHKLIAPSDADRQTLARLDFLTPGDFATVSRRQLFQPLISAAEWIAALDGECALKEGAIARLGFH